jgi:hypothetical protein
MAFGCARARAHAQPRAVSRVHGRVGFWPAGRDADGHRVVPIGIVHNPRRRTDDDGRLAEHGPDRAAAQGGSRT